MGNSQIYVKDLVYLNEDDNKIYIELGYTVNGYKIYFNESEGIVTENKDFKILKNSCVDEVYVNIHEIYKPVNELALIYLNNREKETYKNFFKEYEDFTVWLKELIKFKP